MEGDVEGDVPDGGGGEEWVLRCGTRIDVAPLSFHRRRKETENTCVEDCQSDGPPAVPHAPPRVPFHDGATLLSWRTPRHKVASRLCFARTGTLIISVSAALLWYAVQTDCSPLVMAPHVEKIVGNEMSCDVHRIPPLLQEKKGIKDVGTDVHKEVDEDNVVGVMSVVEIMEEKGKGPIRKTWVGEVPFPRTRNDHEVSPSRRMG